MDSWREQRLARNLGYELAYKSKVAKHEKSARKLTGNSFGQFSFFLSIYTYIYIGLIARIAGTHGRMDLRTQA